MKGHVLAGGEQGGGTWELSETGKKPGITLRYSSAWCRCGPQSWRKEEAEAGWRSGGTERRKQVDRLGVDEKGDRWICEPRDRSVSKAEGGWLPSAQGW